MDLSRRTLLASAGAVSATTVLASCAGFTGQPQQGGGGTGSGGTTTLTFNTWGSDEEIAAYKKLIDQFEQANTGVTVKLNNIPYANFFTNIDSQLQAGKAPDIFRLGYGQIGGYSNTGALLDITSSFSGAESDAFIPAFWQAVQYEGKAYGVPQQTDTSAIVYNTAALEDAGITSFPDSLDSAWSFEEFAETLATLRDSVDPKRYPFGYNWQLYGATRWASWLFSTGGRLLNEDLSAGAVAGALGTKALDYTRRFFEENWTPANLSTKSPTYADTVWLAQTIAMVSAGNFLVPEFLKAKFDWGVTYLPQDVRGADDLGGNALVAAAEGANTELAAKFLKFMVTEDAMKTFCAETLELPTLQSLVGQDIGWDVPEGVMPVFADQATTITADDVAQLSVPAAADINTVLRDELEAAFRQDQATATTLENIDAGIGKALQA